MEIVLGKWYATSEGKLCITERLVPHLGVRILLNDGSVRIVDTDVFLAGWQLIEEEDENKTAAPPAPTYDCWC